MRHFCDNAEFFWWSLFLKHYTTVQDPFRQHKAAPSKTENITQEKKSKTPKKTKRKAAGRRQAVSGVIFRAGDFKGKETGP